LYLISHGATARLEPRTSLASEIRQPHSPSAPHRAGGDRVARDRVGLTEEAKKRFAILGDCSTPAKPEDASGWWIPAAWLRVASGDV
jgi:hypothetical protein